MSTSWSREAAFIGRITAGATHEIRNVLAIVKESAGLIEDLLVASGGSGVDRERILKATARIETQMDRGAEQLTQLNRFAHSLDLDRSGTDLAEEVQRVAFFCRRVARAGSQQVEALEAGPLPLARADPLHVQMAVFSVAEYVLEHLPAGAILTLRAEVREGRGVVHLQGRAEPSRGLPLAGHEPGWDRLCGELDDLGASVEAVPDGFQLRVVLP